VWTHPSSPSLTASAGNGMVWGSAAVM
jgi:hypothetical protein